MSEPLFCPECRSEFVPTATLCPDCELALVPESHLGSEAVEELPDISQLVCVRAASVAWAQGLSERLADAGISHRIEVAHDDEEDGSARQPGANLPYGVYVLAEDVESATAIDAEFTRYQIPDVPNEGQPIEASDDACPACGSAVAPGVAECPDCGIVLLIDG